MNNIYILCIYYNKLLRYIYTNVTSHNNTRNYDNNKKNSKQIIDAFRRKKYAPENQPVALYFHSDAQYYCKLD